MAKQTPVLIKTFTADAAVLRANLALVMSPTNAGNVAAPAAAGATKFVGVSQGPSDANNVVSAMTHGIAQIESDGSAVINAGDYVGIANITGQIKTVAPAFAGATLAEILGITLSSAAAVAGLLVDVDLQPMLHKP